MREVIDAASKLDEVPPIHADASYISHNYRRFRRGRRKGFLYFPVVNWNHADLQLRKRLQLEARILLRRLGGSFTLLGKARIYRQMQMGTFTVTLNPWQRAVTWSADEIHEWPAGHRAQRTTCRWAGACDDCSVASLDVTRLTSDRQPIRMEATTQTVESWPYVQSDSKVASA